jgi:hypothetical protein
MLTTINEGKTKATHSLTEPTASVCIYSTAATKKKKQLSTTKNRIKREKGTHTFRRSPHFIILLSLLLFQILPPPSASVAAHHPHHHPPPRPTQPSNPTEPFPNHQNPSYIRVVRWVDVDLKAAFGFQRSACRRGEDAEGAVGAPMH